MSVLKAERKESDFYVLTHAHDLRKDLTDLMYRNFGYKKRRVRAVDRDGWPKTREQLDREQAQADYDDAYYTWMLQRSRDHIDRLLREMSDSIVEADSIWATCLAECDERRLCQDRAIANCFQIEQELQYVLETLLFDINKFTRYADSLKEEIELLKKWRKSDNKIRREILRKQS